MLFYPEMGYNRLFFLLYFPIIILAKIVRWTILRETTVDAGIGHEMLGYIIGRARLHEDVFGSNVANARAIEFYKFFNWFGLDSYIEFEVAITIVFNLVLWIILKNFFCKIRLSFMQMFFLLLVVGVMNIYTYCLSKEPPQMIYFLLLFWINEHSWNEKRRTWGCVIVILLMVLFSRSYFILMLAFFLGIRMLYPITIKKTVRHPRISFLLILVLTGITYDGFMHFSSMYLPSDFEELVRVRTRIDENTTTQIFAVLPPDNLELFSINYVLTILRMLFPMELLLYGPKYVPFIIFQTLVSCIMIKALIVEYDYCSASKRIATALYWGFMFCSATFEPDFGSWVRHESVAIPIILFALSDREGILLRLKKETRSVVDNVAKNSLYK